MDEPMGEVRALAAAESTAEHYGTMPDGTEVRRFTLSNAAGMKAVLIEYGATLVELWVPDARRQSADVVLGFDDLDGYRTQSPYFGCTTGRVANRIAGGRFELDGVEYQLATNNGEHHLHGGERGLDKVVWTGEEVECDQGRGIRFRYVSPDGEESYPGTVEMEVTYWLTNANELRIDYRATTDRATPLNLTHHSYFNLRGAENGGILDHQLKLWASHYTPGGVAPDGDPLIPTGEIAAVTGTPFDFTSPHAIGQWIADVEGGYDLNFVVDGSAETLRPAAELFDPESGRLMSIWTTEPGIQFYTGNFLDGSITGKGGVVYAQHHGLCLETQHYPNAINTPSFPSIVLSPDEMYRHTIVHRFAIRDPQG